MIEAITDHTTRALARLKTVFRSSVEFQGLISALATQAQVLEDAINDAREILRDPALCVTRSKDATLTRIGKLVKARAQGSLTQAEFRDLILGQIQVNISQGNPDALIAIFNAALGPSIGNVAQVSDSDPSLLPTGYRGGVGVLYLSGVLDFGNFTSLEFARNAMALIKSATPAGGRTLVTIAIEPIFQLNNPFLLDSSPTDNNNFRMLSTFDSPETVR